MNTIKKTERDKVNAEASRLVHRFRRPDTVRIGSVVTDLMNQFSISQDRARRAAGKAVRVWGGELVRARRAKRDMK